MSTATTRAICHTQTDERLAQAIWKRAQRHNQSCSTRKTCREGCASDIDINTAPQRQRSDTHKVTKCLNGCASHIRTAPQWKRSDAHKVRGACASTCYKISTKYCAHHEIWILKMCTRMFSWVSGTFLRRGLGVGCEKEQDCGLALQDGLDARHSDGTGGRGDSFSCFFPTAYDGPNSRIFPMICRV